MQLAPLVVAVPLGAAAALAVAALAVGRRVLDLIATLVALAVTVMAFFMLAQVTDGTVIHWFGDWRPVRGVALGIDFVVDPISAGIAAFGASVVTLAFVFSWRYLETVAGHFYVLMLVLLAAVEGLALSGDLFNMFVFLELMTVASIGLAGYQTAESGTLRGVLGFAVVNSIGAFLVLWGIGLLYGQTGALNLAQIGEALAGAGASPLVTAAFVLLVSGFLVKAAVVPFHFWLVDTYSSAISPIGVVFAAVTGEMGLYAIARVYWTVFDDALAGSAPTITVVLVAFGCVTALLGAVMSFVQRHLRRTLAFAVIAHTGMMLVGVAVLSAEGVSGTVAYLVADGVVKALLFMVAGITHHKLSDIDELHLRGKGRGLRLLFGLFVLGGLALAGMPPLATFMGKFLIEEAALHEGYGWVQPIFVVASAVTGAAVLRAAGRIFLGSGPGERDEHLISRSEVDVEEVEFGATRGVPVSLLGPACLLAAAALIGGLVVPLEQGVAAGETFVDQHGYADFVLRAHPLPLPHTKPIEFTSTAIALGILSSLLAVALATVSLLQGRWSPARTSAERRVERVVAPLRTLHRGHVGDYVAWVTVGVAVLGAALALAAP